MLVLFKVQALVVLSTFVLLVFYVRHLLRNLSMTPDDRAKWMMRLLLFNVIAMPIYWFYYVYCAGNATMRSTSP